MTENDLKTVAGALLLDLGRVLSLGEGGRLRHQSGEEALAKLGVQDEFLFDLIRLRGKSELRELPAESPAYIVYLADQIAASANTQSDPSGEPDGPDSLVPLESIFNRLNGNDQKMYYRPAMIDAASGWNMPAGEPAGYDGFLKEVCRKLQEGLSGAVSGTREYVESLLCLLEECCSYIPCSRATRESADISLFDHSKMTAAYALAIARYRKEAEETDFREALSGNAGDFYGKKAFLLISADLSGIQKFIYTIHSEGALRMLRSRSFYLEIIMEHLIDLMLDRMDLTRANLIYSGGGHCYILAPNTKTALDAVEFCRRTVNEFFLEKFDISLYAAVAAVPCSAGELSNKPAGSYAALFRELSRKLSECKGARYLASDILRLNRRRHKDSTRECRICKSSGKLDEMNRCSLCASLEDFSRQILYKDTFPIFSEYRRESLELPGGFFLAARTEDELRESMKDPAYVRSYSKNRFYTGCRGVTKLWVGDYTQKNMTTEDYAKAAEGINRIAVLRADVDNLGQAFVSGFAPDQTTLSRTAAFSRMLSLFFKHYINSILGESEFGMHGKPAGPRKATIVYSGGDDIFLVGSWNDVFECAVDLRDRLEVFSQGTLSVSAGIGVYSAKYPISVSAVEVAGLEEKSKSYPEAKAPSKNAVTVFGDGQTYDWECWKTKVTGEKLSLLYSFLEDFKERGNAFLYHLLELIRGMDDRINLARFAYVLTRLEPEGEEQKERRQAYRSFVRTMYQWVQDEEERRQLVTAIYLYVYLNRKKEGEES